MEYKASPEHLIGRLAVLEFFVSRMLANQALLGSNPRAYLEDIKQGVMSFPVHEIEVRDAFRGAGLQMLDNALKALPR